MGFFFSCLVIEFFLKATYSQPGVVWPHDFGQQPARRLRSRDRSHPGALGRGPRSLRSQPPPLTTAQPFAPQMGKPETETFFPAPPSSAIRACSERAECWGAAPLPCRGTRRLPTLEQNRGWRRFPKKILRLEKGQGDPQNVASSLQGMGMQSQRSRCLRSLGGGVPSGPGGRALLWDPACTPQPSTHAAGAGSAPRTTAPSPVAPFDVVPEQTTSRYRPTALLRICFGNNRSQLESGAKK